MRRRTSLGCVGGRVAVIVAATALVLVAPAPGAAAQARTEEPRASVVLVLDASGSMNADDGTGRAKIDAAQEALLQMVDVLPQHSLVGLRVFGHRVPNTDKRRGCKDTELIVPVRPLASAQMKNRIRSFEAKGFTPIALSLQAAAKDLPDEGRRTIVLVSDGIDTCAPPPPCKVAKRIVARGVNLRIDTVGFQVNARARRQLRCIARVANGAYADAASSAELATSLQRVSVRALRTYETRGTQVSGGTSSEAAPVVATGQYVDSIGLREQRWYAIVLEPGEWLRVAATVVGAQAGRGAPLNSMTLSLYNPAGEELGFEGLGRAVGIGEGVATAVLQSPRVGDQTASGYQQPGSYRVQVQTDARGGGSPTLPIELLFQVAGDRNGAGGSLRASASPTASTPAPSGPTEADDEPTVRPAAGQGDDRDDGDDNAPLPALIAVGLVSVVVGAFAGSRLAKRIGGGV